MWSSETTKLEERAIFTTKEINHQPDLWKKIWQKVYDERVSIKAFIGDHLRGADQLILTGAGTSAYIGIASQNSYRNKYGKVTEPISTTHLVSHPEDFLLADQKICLVSFARSGNSPESCAAVDLVNKIAGESSHLIITCNEDGRLASSSNTDNAYVFVLPPQANDKSLAMTSSYSGMLLASILISRIDEIEALESEIEKLSECGRSVLEASDQIMKIASRPFTRSVFLGAGPLYGVAKEAQLKMSELTDGLVMCKHDSFLGLRHGPRAVINEETLLVYHLSSNKHARKYELDLLNAMRENSSPLGQLIVGENISDINNVDWKIDLCSPNSAKLDEDLISVVSILPAQLLSLYKSLDLGLTPDNPSRNGAISRVVKGVNIYNY